MRLTPISLIAAIALAISGCGEKSTAPSSASSALAAKADSDSPLDAPVKVKGGEELDVERFFEIFPDYMEPRYDDVSYDAKSGATIVSNLRVVAPGDASGTDGFKVERAEFYKVDLDAVERVKSAEGAALDAPFEPIFEKIRLFGIKDLNNNGNSARTEIGAMEIDRLRIRQGGIPKDETASGLAVLANAFDVAGLYFKDIGVVDRQGVDGVAIEMTAPDLRLVGIGGGRLSAIVAKDLDYNIEQSTAALAEAGRVFGPAGEMLVNGPLRNFVAPESQRTKVEMFEWRDIDFSGLMAFGLKDETPPVTERDLIDLGTMRAENTETFVGDKRLSFVPEAVVSAMEFSWLAPSKFRAVSRGASYDFTAYLPDSESEAIVALKKYKLDKIKGDSDFAYDWGPDNGRAVASAGFASSGFADFDFDLSLEGLELDKIAAAQAQGDPNAVAGLAKLKSIAIVFDDETMLDAFYELAALQAGGSAEDMRLATPSMLRFSSMEIGRVSPRLKDYVDAIADFLEDGGTLEIRAEPEQPMSVAEIQALSMQGPDAAINAVNLTVTQSD